MKKEKKLYIVRKYIYATSAKEAIRLQSKNPVDDVYIGNDWLKAQREKPSAIGFSTTDNEDE